MIRYFWGFVKEILTGVQVPLSSKNGALIERFYVVR